MPATTTIDEVVTRARVLLNDKDATAAATETSELERFANDASIALFNLRPDLFVDQYPTVPTGAVTTGQTLPVDNRYIPAIVDYVVARTSSKDDEFVLAQRMATMLQSATLALGGQGR